MAAPAAAATYPSNLIVMNSDSTSLEAQLRDLQAATLDEAFLLRLEAAADGSLTQLSPEETRFESSLRRISPANLSPELLSELTAIVHEVPFAVDEKIVLFPKAASSATVRTHRPMWGAAAAVALIGALSALLVPADKAREMPVPQTAAVSSPPAATPARTNLIPAGFDRGVREVSDEGIVWKSNNQPHSMVRVVYQDKITLKDERGRTFQLEQPRTQIMLVPAKTD